MTEDDWHQIIGTGFDEEPPIVYTKKEYIFDIYALLKRPFTDVDLMLDGYLYDDGYYMLYDKHEYSKNCHIIMT